MANPSINSGRAATSMADLMAKAQPSIKSFKKGETVVGKVTKLTSSEILVDIGAKTEASVLEKDKNLLKSLLSTLKLGDSVDVYILNPESDMGNPVVSLRKFMDEKVWGKIEKLKDEKKVLSVNVDEITKGGFLVSAPDGISGFLPNSQTMLSTSPKELIGTKLNAVILEVNRSLHKIIFSQKAATTDEDFLKIVNGIKVGDKISAVVSNSAPFGIFVSFKSPNGDIIEGFIHLSEISWERIESAEGYHKNGEEVEAQVITIDKEAKRVNLSIKRLTADPFEEAVKDIKVDSKVKGKVKSTSSLGVLVELNGIDGLIKKDKIAPGTKYNAGDEVDLTVVEIDSKRHRIIVSPVLKEKPMGYR